jgi:hypothetical protein
LAELLSNRGRSEDYPRVEALAREALDHNDATPYSQRWSWEVLARLALARGEPARAEAHLGEALHLARHSQGTQLLRFLEKLADLCLDQDRLEEAEAHLREAAGQVISNLDAISFGWRYDLTLSLARLRAAQAKAADDRTEARRRYRQTHHARRYQRRWAVLLDRRRDSGRVARVDKALAELTQALADLEETPQEPMAASGEAS